MTTNRSPKEILLESSRRTSTGEAVLWFAEGHPVMNKISHQEVIWALSSLSEAEPNREQAIRSVVREAASSHLDPSAMLFSVESIARPETIRKALDALTFRSPTQSLLGLTASSVQAALQDEPGTMDTLALIAGLTPNEMRRRLGDESPKGKSWTLRQIQSAVRLVNEIVQGTARSSVADAVPARPVELLMSGKSVASGWIQVEEMRISGVPYEVLLAQRLVGSPWGIHRNSTSSKLGAALIGELCLRLEQLGTKYLRSSSMGGTAALTKISPVGKTAALMTSPNDGGAPWSVIVSVANDTGTANKSAAQLIDIVDGKENVAVLLAGPGWAERLPETSILAQKVFGHIYSDRDLDLLARTVSVTARTYTPGDEET